MYFLIFDEVALIVAISNLQMIRAYILFFSFTGDWM